MLGLNRIPILMKVCARIYGKVKPKNLIMTEAQGFKIWLDPKDDGVTPHLLLRGVFEEHETKLFKTLIKSGMVVIDIGANIGYYTLMASRLVGPKGRVIAFEPEPHNYELLERNVKANGLNNVMLHKKAVADKSGAIELFVDSQNYSNPTIGKNRFGERAHKISVESITLDEFVVKELDGANIDFIKIDVEGAEGHIIKGAQNVLTRQRPIITMEFWPQALRNAGTEPADLLNKMTEFGFSISTIKPTSKWNRGDDASRLVEVCDHRLDGDVYANLVMKKDQATLAQ